MYDEPQQLSSEKTITRVENEQSACVGISPKTTYEWPLDIRKTVQYHKFPGRCMGYIFMRGFK